MFLEPRIIILSLQAVKVLVWNINLEISNISVNLTIFPFKLKLLLAHLALFRSKIPSGKLCREPSRCFSVSRFFIVDQTLHFFAAQFLLERILKNRSLHSPELWKTSSYSLRVRKTSKSFSTLEKTLRSVVSCLVVRMLFSWFHSLQTTFRQHHGSLVDFLFQGRNFRPLLSVASCS